MTTSVARFADRRAWLGLAVLALPTILLGLDVTALYLAVPVLAADLRPNPTETLWIMDGYGFMIAGLLVTMGTLGDRIGRRRLLMIGAVAFGLASVAAAFAPSATLLIVARAALGVAGATLMPSTLALIGVLFRDARQRGLAFGVWATMFGLGMALGPIAGGLLLQWFWWGSVFLIAVPIVAVVLIAGPLVLPEYRAPDAGRLDLVSVAQSLLAILPLVYAIKHGAAAGIDLQTVAAAVLGAAFTTAFLRRQRRIADPLLDLALFRAPAFTAALTVLLLALVGVGGAMYVVTQHLQLVEQMSPLTAGVWMGVAAIGMVAAGVGAPVLARYVRPAVIVAATLIASAVGYLLFALVEGPGNPALVVVGFALVFVGLGTIAALGTDLVVSGAPTEKGGSAAAMSETVQELGIAVGVAVLGSLVGVVYRGGVAGLDGPAATSLEGAILIADQLPAGALDAARLAQTTGLNIVGIVAAVASVALAVVSLMVLRKVDTTPASD